MPGEPQWTEEEKETLKELYGEVPTEELAEEFGRTVNAVRIRAHMLGASESDQGKLSEDDKQYIRENLGKKTIEEIADNLDVASYTVRYWRDKWQEGEIE